MQKAQNILLYLWTAMCFHGFVFGQAPADSLPLKATLEDCIAYALQHQGQFQQTELDKEINERTIKSNLAAWYPQLRTEYNYQHYFKVPVSLIPDFSNPAGPRRATTLGVPNTSNVQFQADQVFYNSDVLLAAKASKYSRQQTQQDIEKAKIALISDVSKAFYNVLLTQQQMGILEEDIQRQQKLLKDAYNQYQSGALDKIDYKRTSISLNNTLSQKRKTEESVKYKYTNLKYLMGYPTERQLTVVFDTLAMKQEALMDTSQALNYEQRIEYQLLKTQLELQTLNVKYYQWSALPTVTGSANYTFLYLSQNARDLYNKVYPNYYAAVKVAMPIFQGNRRGQNLQKAKLQAQRVKLGMSWTKEQISNQYSESMGVYKSNLNDFKVQEENMKVAKEVYGLVKLQYDEGIRAYIDVISSETDLRNSQMNYLNALYNVLASKLDVERSLGTLKQ